VLFSKKAISRTQSFQVTPMANTNTAYDYDLIVIGAGSGGVRAGRIAAGHGARVAVIEGDRPGGTCVIRGCVPKKLLMYGSVFSSDVEDARGFGWQIDAMPLHDWGSLIAAKDAELDRLEAIYRNLLSNAGATLIAGWAQVTGPHDVTVNGTAYSAEKILIAVGGTPQIVDAPGLADHAITSNEALDLTTFPGEIVVYGSGYIALEFAGIFNGFGAKTHLVYRSDLPLRGFDEDVRIHIATALADRGVILHNGCTIEKVSADNDRKQVTLSSGARLNVDAVMAATGRRPNTAGLGLEALGVKTGQQGEIIVDAASRSTVPSIFAVGDVTNRINLTPVAIAEGHAFADSEFGGNKRVVDHSNVASAVFSQPPIASVGMSEAEAAKAFDQITVFTSGFRAMKNTISGRGEKTFMKLIVETSTDRVVGVHMMGPDCGEIMQGIAVAIKAGATKADFDATIGIHPTAAEEFVTMRTPR
jgi:glutathione reductase (NADPH)